MPSVGGESSAALHTSNIIRPILAHTLHHTPHPPRECATSCHLLSGRHNTADALHVQGAAAADPAAPTAERWRLSVAVRPVRGELGPITPAGAKAIEGGGSRYLIGL